MELVNLFFNNTANLFNKLKMNHFLACNLTEYPYKIIYNYN